METFGFIVHPIDAKQDMARKYPWARALPIGLIERILLRMSPMVVGHAPEVVSAAGARAEGWFVGCPLSPRQMVDERGRKTALPLEDVYARIVAAGQLAADRGARIVGLGAFTSVAGDGGVTVAGRLPIPVTTGNSYTIGTAVDGALLAAEQVGLDPGRATVGIVGASGSIGRTCALLLADQAAEIVLMGRSVERLSAVEHEVAPLARSVRVAADLKEGVGSADIVITVSSATEAIVEPAWLKPGSVVCDVARPRDVSAGVARARPDVLVIEGGLVAVPGLPDLGWSFGFPPGTAYACMSETMILALEGRYESFTLGKSVSVEQVREINRLACKHGFKLAGFRSFERPVSEEQVARVRKAGQRPEPPVVSLPGGPPR